MTTLSLTVPTALIPLQTGIVGQLMGCLERLMVTIGAPGAALAVFLENVFPPIPSEVILPLAGFAAGQGHFSVLSAVLWTTLGSVTGAWLLYWLGQALGVERLKAIARRLPLTDPQDIDTALGWFDRHGGKAVFVGRMIPGVRSLISIPAGLHRMSPALFTLYTTLGSLAWNALLIYAGYALGHNWALVEGWVARVQDVVMVLLLAAAGWFITRRIRSRRRQRAAESQESAPERELVDA
ncbi:MULTISPECIES: DedA family protein [unclassified Luteococcus]|uniref:DedA family protein n=1 Tax=unclassified Luteococcus TaxID=2639923 RepID=UPI00313E71B3